MQMTKAMFARYLALVVVTALILLGVRYATQYLFSSPVDWNITIGVTAIALPLIIQFGATLFSKQRENQLKIEQVQTALDTLPRLQQDIDRLDQIAAIVAAHEGQLHVIEGENRKQEKLIARIEAVLETTIQQEQLHARMDRLSDILQQLEKRFLSSDNSNSG